MKVENMTSSRGNEVPNQFLIKDNEGTYFQSYNTIIAFRANNGDVKLDSSKWDYSNTTGKYRNQFLGETKKETQQKINSQEYELIDLN